MVTEYTAEQEAEIEAWFFKTLKEDPAALNTPLAPPFLETLKPMVVGNPTFWQTDQVEDEEGSKDG